MKMVDIFRSTHGILVDSSDISKSGTVEEVLDLGECASNHKMFTG